MYLGSLGQGSTGERFRIIAPKGARRLLCPAGTTQDSAGRMATGQQYVWCYRAPQFAPPATSTVTYHAPTTTTTVSPGIQTAVSPQISPTMAQAQASPGSSVQAAPTQTAGGQTADTGYRPGLTGDQVMAMMAAEREARDAREEADRYREGLESARRSQELDAFRAMVDAQNAAQAEAMNRELAERDARQAAIDMADTEATAAAQSSAQYIPPPPSMIPMGPPMLTDPMTMDTPPPGAPGAPVAAPNGTPWGMIMLAVAAVGIVAAGAAGKKRKSKR